MTCHFADLNAGPIAYRAFFFRKEKGQMWPKRNHSGLTFNLKKWLRRQSLYLPKTTFSIFKDTKIFQFFLGLKDLFLR